MCTLLGHTAKVTIARGLYVTSDAEEVTHTLIASTSVDSTVRIWQRVGIAGGKGISFNFGTDNFDKTAVCSNFSPNLYNINSLDLPEEIYPQNTII